MSGSRNPSLYEGKFLQAPDFLSGRFFGTRKLPLRFSPASDGDAAADQKMCACLSPRGGEGA
jgi:hypothetical protein